MPAMTGAGSDKKSGEGDAGTTRAEVFKFCFQTCTTLASAGAAPERALRLLLESALVAKGEQFAHDCVRRALLVFEDVASSRAEPRCLVAVIATLGRLGPIGVGGIDAYMDLATRCTKTTTKLLTEVDRARCSINAAKLFWAPEESAGEPVVEASGKKEGKSKGKGKKKGKGKGGVETSESDSSSSKSAVRNGSLLLRCLQHALSQAEAQDEEPAASLFVEIADAYSCHLIAGVPEVVPDHVNMLLRHCAMLCASQQLSAADGYLDQGQEASVDGAAGRVHLDRLQIHLRSCLEGGGARAARCAGVDVTAADEPSPENLAETLGLEATVSAIQNGTESTGGRNYDTEKEVELDAQRAATGASAPTVGVLAASAELDAPPPPPSGPRPGEGAGRAGDATSGTSPSGVDANDSTEAVVVENDAPTALTGSSPAGDDKVEESGEGGGGGGGGGTSGEVDDWELGEDGENPFGDDDGL